MVSYAINDFHKLVYQDECIRILLMNDHLNK